MMRPPPEMELPLLRSEVARLKSAINERDLLIEWNARLAAENKRALDLVRYCRADLHEAGLITDQEYADIVVANGDAVESVSRLTTYDEMRERIAALESALAERTAEVERLKLDHDHYRQLVAMMNRMEADLGEHWQRMSGSRHLNLLVSVESLVKKLNAGKPRTGTSN